MPRGPCGTRYAGVIQSISLMMSMSRPPPVINDLNVHDAIAWLPESFQPDSTFSTCNQIAGKAQCRRATQGSSVPTGETRPTGRPRTAFSSKRATRQYESRTELCPNTTKGSSLYQAGVVGPSDKPQLKVRSVTAPRQPKAESQIRCLHSFVDNSLPA